ncbi:hypothetical protein P0082_00040 [Candidatus Haliotispira prima]|uniref:Uncharacterized protein n=1 Tax=Candidatus Haliotispira prima TaxID=3034016 RepID=A0ABY8MGY2_9SPIO|nr:hypothetical protein P0082_12480 [Candidatus Haliotispira prima]WGK69281.1 hypothetical protein P0082_00040 [Candidatus Haliotispira prima]
MVSSVQFEVTSIPAITDVGAVIRLAGEAIPTKAEALASKGYVRLSIEANSTRKFSISQHYGSNFEDGGFTLADVLTPNTKYKLYLYMPTAIDLGQTIIKGGAIKGDTVEISFTTTSLPPAGDPIWSEKLAAKEYVGSLNEYHFMENQTGVFVAYFWFSSIPAAIDIATKEGNTNRGVGGHVGRIVTPSAEFYYDGGIITGYDSTVSQYTYSIASDKVASSILRGHVKIALTSAEASFTEYNTVVNRY